MEKALYGRRNAGACVRDFLEEITINTPKYQMVRGDAEPCAFRSICELDVGRIAMTHHIDGRIVADDRAGPKLISHLATYMLLKVSEPVGVG